MAGREDAKGEKFKTRLLRWFRLALNLEVSESCGKILF
jgi:hypothetical protein